MDLDVLSFSLVPRIVCSSRSENLMGEEASAPPRKVATSRLCEVSRYFMSIFYLLLSCSGYVLVMMNLLFWRPLRNCLVSTASRQNWWSSTLRNLCYTFFSSLEIQVHCAELLSFVFIGLFVCYLNDSDGCLFQGFLRSINSLLKQYMKILKGVSLSQARNQHPFTWRDFPATYD